MLSKDATSEVDTVLHFILLVIHSSTQYLMGIYHMSGIIWYRDKKDSISALLELKNSGGEN